MEAILKNWLTVLLLLMQRRKSCFFTSGKFWDEKEEKEEKPIVYFNLQCEELYMWFKLNMTHSDKGQSES